MTAAIDTRAVEAIFELPLPDGTFKPSTEIYLRSLGARKAMLLLAFAPKTAGTFFREAAIRALGAHLVRGVHAQGGRDATPYLPNFIARYLEDEPSQDVMHLHMQAFPANRHFLRAFDLKPIIMLRDISDCLASFWDMLDRDPVARSDGLNCKVPSDFPAFNPRMKAAFLIDMIAPWYVSYFATWAEYASESNSGVLVLSYRDFGRRPSQTVYSAVAYAGFKATHQDCEAALNQVWSERKSYRHNKGVEGRGSAYFSEAERAKLAAMLSHYKKVKPWLAELASTNTL